eukprot:sb/3470495/
MAMAKPHVYFRQYRSITPAIAAQNPSLQRALTFTLIRNPWRRLYSAFKDKIAGYPAFNDYEYTRIILRVVRGWSMEQVENTPSVIREVEESPIGFGEFLKYIAESDTDNLNDHWAPWFLITWPCHIKYDLVGYHEDFEATFKVLKDTLFSDYKTGLKGQYRGSAGREDVIRAYQDVPRVVIEQIYTMYSEEFVLGDYDIRPGCV